LTVSIDVAAAPPGGDRGSVMSGGVTLATERSRLVLLLSGEKAPALVGDLDVEDVLRAGLLRGPIGPRTGVVAVDVAIDPARRAARGTIACARLALSLSERADVLPYILEGVRADVVADRASFA